MKFMLRLFGSSILVIGLLFTSCSKDGMEGPIGPQGPQGEQGIQGPEGPQGPAGQDAESQADPDAQVEEGTSSDGQDGTDGQDGETGAQGPKGEQGDQGPKGDSGADGEDGDDGEDGKDGENGNANVDAFIFDISSASGTSYVKDISKLTAQVIAEQAVLGYLEVEPISNFPLSNSQYAIPASNLLYKDVIGIPPNTTDVLIDVTVRLSPGSYGLYFYDKDGAEIDLQSGYLQKLKLIIIAPTRVTGKSRKTDVLSELRNAGVDVKDYDAVAKHYRLRN